MVKRCLDCNKKLVQDIDACPLCGGATIEVPRTRTVDRSRFHLRRKFCESCEHFGNHRRGNVVRQGCGLMEKPCSVEAAWLTSESEWCPGEKASEFALQYPYRSQTIPTIQAPGQWHHSITPTSEFAVITVAAGKRSHELLEYTGPRMERYAESCGADFIALTDDQFPSFRIGNKFRLADVGKHYRKTLYVDADAWLEDSLPNLFELRDDRVWWHSDRYYLKWFDWFDWDCSCLETTQSVEIPKQLDIFNTGVVLFTNEQADMWKAPTKPFFDSHTVEQTWVEVQARSLGLKSGRLPIWFNLQYWMKQEWGNRPAHIHHLANAPHEYRIEWLKARSASRSPLAV